MLSGQLQLLCAIVWYQQYTSDITYWFQEARQRWAIGFRLTWKIQKRACKGSVLGDLVLKVNAEKYEYCIPSANWENIFYFYYHGMDVILVMQIDVIRTVISQTVDFCTKVSFIRTQTRSNQQAREHRIYSPAGSVKGPVFSPEGFGSWGDFH